MSSKAYQSSDRYLHAAKFFALNYGSDSIEESNFEDYVDLVVFEYFGDNQDDRDGTQLLAEIDQIAGERLTEEQLSLLIADTWRSCGGPHPGKTWQDVLQAVRQSLIEFRDA